MIKYTEDKFNDHPENMFSLQRHKLFDVPTEEANYSLVAPK